MNHQPEFVVRADLASVTSDTTARRSGPNDGLIYSAPPITWPAGTASIRFRGDAGRPPDAGGLEGEHAAAHGDAVGAQEAVVARHRRRDLDGRGYDEQPLGRKVM